LNPGQVSESRLCVLSYISQMADRSPPGFTPRVMPPG
jgi:hypothetical protein